MTRVASERSRVDVVAIGVSTGGPNALAMLLQQFPADLPVPVVVVQHMPPLFTRLLAERLDAKLHLHVHEAAGGEQLDPGHAWLAPGDHHMVVARNGHHAVLELNQEPPVNSCRPSIDVLFHSVATVFGAHALAVVLTGMGSDGLRGCEAIHHAGGRILVQDEASSVVWGMPKCVANAGIADDVLSLDDLGPKIIHRLHEGRPRGVAGVPADNRSPRR
jgi:two-component system, chemotaxis family, protein-glutamate methylesterase/glutaminase